MESFSVQKVIDEVLRAKQAARVPKTQNSWHCSSIGSCMTGNYLARKGVKSDAELEGKEKFDERTLRVFDMGSKIEDWIVNLIKENPDYEAVSQGRVEDTKLGYSGYYDLKIKNKKTGEEIMFEVKSKNSKAFWWMIKKGQGANSQHKRQLWLYLHHTGLPKGHIVYASKDDSAIEEFIVLRDDEKLAKSVLGELAILQEAWEKQIAPPPAPEDSWQAKFCAYHKQCVNQPEYLNKEHKYE